jgi:hypothetical protein
MSTGAWARLSPNLTGVVAAGLVAVGVFLWMFVDESLLLVAGLGAFGPGILRELGVLNDQDEFQREAARRAGYHAYLAGGLLAIVILVFLEWSGADAGAGGEWVSLVLVVLWLSWLASSVMEYWGAQKTTFWVMLAFGWFWALFGLAHVVGAILDPEPIEDYGEFFLGVAAVTLLVAPWFVLAWTAKRWPRGTAVALLGTALVLLVVFIRPFQPSGLPLPSRVLTAVLLLGPFLACGIALWTEAVLDGGRGDSEAEGEEDHV